MVRPQAKQTGRRPRERVMELLMLSIEGVISP